jgi:uncharacterized membrane protein YraQ (UPF0718 family)
MVVLAVVVLLVAGLSFGLAREAWRGSDGAAALLRLEMIVLIIGGCLAVFASLVAFNLRCDDGCAGATGKWWHDHEAWQWTAQLVTSIVMTFALIGAGIASFRSRYRPAAWLTLIAAIGFTVWGSFLAPLGDRFGI